MLIDTSKSPHALSCFPARAVWQGGFFGALQKTCAERAIPHILSIFDDPDSFFHEVENFRIAAGRATGEFRGNPYGDGDFYKLLEAMTIAGRDVDEYIELIAAAQQPDGYLSTKQIIRGRRHADANDFEEYNFGHLFTAACVNMRETGDRRLLDVAEKTAAYLARHIGDAEKNGAEQTAVCPSHYMGLAEMYRATGKSEYLDTLKAAIALRDRVKNGSEDNQDRVPLREQRVISGHAVRATYLYAGVADVYLETGEQALADVLNACWRNMVDTKTYITGGIGALYTGCAPFGDIIHSQRVHQAFGYEYQLPNITAYNETCAALGAVFWAQRMFAIEPKAEYFDFIERVAMNLAPGAIGLDGERYFYENMLRRTESVAYTLMWPRERTDTFECFCCPTNLSRFLMETGEYAYAQSSDSVYTGLYGANEAEFALANGAAFKIRQSTRYPWNGEIRFEIERKNDAPFTLMLRVPAWSRSGKVVVDDTVTPLGATHAGKYFPVGISGEGDVRIDMSLDISPRFTAAHPMVEEDEAQVCVERGPLVYCLESADQVRPELSGLFFREDAGFSESPIDISGASLVAVSARGWMRELRQGDALYERYSPGRGEEITLRLIPYFAWDNRGFGEMRVWLPLAFS